MKKYRLELEDYNSANDVKSKNANVLGKVHSVIVIESQSHCNDDRFNKQFIDITVGKKKCKVKVDQLKQIIDLFAQRLIS